MTNDEEEDKLTKRFKGFLILDWRDRSMRVLVRKPNKIKPHELVIKIDVGVSVPEQRDVELKGDFEIPQAKVNELFLDQV